jgi:hypothetical protein
LPDKVLSNHSLLYPDFKALIVHMDFEALKFYARKIVLLRTNIPATYLCSIFVLTFIEWQFHIYTSYRKRSSLSFPDSLVDCGGLLVWTGAGRLPSPLPVGLRLRVRGRRFFITAPLPSIGSAGEAVVGSDGCWAGRGDREASGVISFACALIGHCF